MATLHTLRSKTPPVAPGAGTEEPAPGRNFDDADMPPPLPEDSLSESAVAAEVPEPPVATADSAQPTPEGVSHDLAGRIYADFEAMTLREEVDAPMDLVDRPQGFSGRVVAASDVGVAVRNGEAISYVPLHLFGEPAPKFEAGQPVSLVLEDRDGKLQARALDRIGATVPPPAAERSKPKPTAPTAAAPSPEQVAEAARQLAENLHGSRPGPTPPQSGAAGPGSLLDNPLVQRAAFGSMAAGAVLAVGAGAMPALAAGVLAAGGGSLALAGIKRANDSVQHVVEAGRIKVSDVLAKQVNSLAADIERDTNWLRAHGMESIVTQMKDTGQSLREVLPQMQRGGPLENLGLQMKGMLAEPEFAQRYAALEANLTRFGLKADRYAKTMVALGRDPEAFLEGQTERVGKAVEGMPVEKDGKFSALTEKVAEIAESIKAVINKIMGRMSPGRN